jgi:hypothetical protein
MFPETMTWLLRKFNSYSELFVSENGFCRFLPKLLTIIKSFKNLEKSLELIRNCLPTIKWFNIKIYSFSELFKHISKNGFLSNCFIPMRNNVRNIQKSFLIWFFFFSITCIPKLEEMKKIKKRWSNCYATDIRLTDTDFEPVSENNKFYFVTGYGQSMARNDS